MSADTLRLRNLHKNGLIENPAKLGEHLRNRRLILGLTQAQVAFRLGTIREVYERWERDERTPVVSVWPSILDFLGYYPNVGIPSNLTLMVRRSAGLDQKKLAKKAGIMHQRLRDWEREREQPSAEQLQRLKKIAEAVAQVSKPSSSISD